MIVAESRRGRRIVGRLDRGADLLATLTKICSERHVRSGEVRALGALEQVEICEYDQRARTYRPGHRFLSTFEILSLIGNISERSGSLQIHAHVTLSRERDNGIEVVGGHLMSARVFACEFVIETYDDLILRRTIDEATGLPLWTTAISAEGDGSAAPAVASSPPAAGPAAPPVMVPARDRPQTASPPAAAPEHAPQPPMPAFEARPQGNIVDQAAGSRWAEVAAASAAAHAAEDEDEDDEAETDAAAGAPADEVRLRPGDLIDHPKFGRCEVERIEGDYEFAAVRLRNHRLVRLSLEIVRLSLLEREGSRQVFKATVQT